MRYKDNPSNDENWAEILKVIVVWREIHVKILNTKNGAVATFTIFILISVQHKVKGLITKF